MQIKHQTQETQTTIRRKICKKNNRKKLKKKQKVKQIFKYSELFLLSEGNV